MDGTGSEWFARDSESYRDAFRTSHVQRLYDSWIGVRHYLEGPLVLGLNTDQIAARVARDVGRRSGVQGVVLSGYSRGGAAVIVAAQMLALRGIDVDCLVLFDAVDRSPAIDSTIIPANVSLVLHAMRNPAAASRESFGNAGTEVADASATQYVRREFMGTHGAIGGVPWKPGISLSRGPNRRHGPPMQRRIVEGGIDLGTNVTFARDAAASKEVWEWIRREVRRRFPRSFRG